MQRVSGSAQGVHTIGWAVPGKGLAVLPGSPRSSRPPKETRCHVFAGLGPFVDKRRACPNCHPTGAGVRLFVELDG